MAAPGAVPGFESKLTQISEGFRLFGTTSVCPGRRRRQPEGWTTNWVGNTPRRSFAFLVLNGEGTPSTSRRMAGRVAHHSFGPGSAAASNCRTEFRS